MESVLVVALLVSRCGAETARRLQSQGCQNTISFTYHPISTSRDGAYSVFAADLNNDGYVDVLSASVYDDTIAWYENDGMSPPGFTARVITSAADGARSVYAADLDNDGDLDVLFASFWDDTITWFENSGGSSPVFLRRTITTSAGGARSVYAADFDNDGDVDVLSASNWDDTIAWYENDGLSPPNFTARVITCAADGAIDVYAADLDNDGDVDVLSASKFDGTIAWYENDGASPPSFTMRVITDAAAYISVYAADLNRDGHLDVVAASVGGSRMFAASDIGSTISWFENDGTSSPWFLEWTIPNTRAEAVFAEDLDSDGDVDVLAASYYDGTIVWYENQGFPPHYVPGFTINQTITTAANGPQSLYAIDLDNDGDVDVLSASSKDDTIAWYENDCVLTPSPTRAPTPEPTPQPTPKPALRPTPEATRAPTTELVPQPTAPNSSTYPRNDAEPDPRESG